MRLLAVGWQFAIDLVIGDDPKIAVAVVAALGASALVLVVWSAPAGVVTVFGAAAVLAAFTVSLLIDAAAHSKRGSGDG